MRTREQFDIEVNIRQIWLIIRRRWPIIIVSGFLGAVGGGVPPMFDAPIYQSGGTLQLVPQQSISFVGLSNDRGLLNPTSALSNPLATETLVIKSRPILEKVANQLQLRDSDGNPLGAGYIGDNLEVEMITQTDVLRLAFRSGRAADAAQVVNTLMHVYIENNVETNRQQAKATRSFIDEQLPKVEAELQGVEFALRRFKENNEVISLDREAVVVTESVAALEAQILAQERELATVNFRLEFVNRELGLTPEQALNANALSQSAGVQEVFRALQQLELELENQRSRFTDANPVVQSLIDRRNRLETILAERVNQITAQSLDDYAIIEAGQQEQALRASIVDDNLASLGLQRSLTALRAKLNSFENRAEQIPRLEQQQRELERKHQAARTTYETLLAGLQEARVRENQEVGNVRIITPAEVPVFPANAAKLISLELIAGGMLGGFLGFSIAILLELLDRSIRTEYEARRFFHQYPVIGTIPAWYPQDWPVLAEGEYRDVNYNLPLVETSAQPSSPLYAVTVAYRRLQTNLKLINREQKARILAVTSSIPGEGKSVTAANLAVSLSLLSNRVLLLEADMAAPQQHEIWRLNSVWGLGNVLQEQIISEQAIQSITPNLDIMSAGIVAPHLVALLDSDRMELLIRRMSEIYDYVIVDSPALLVAPEMLSLSKLTDGVLLVLRPGVLNKTDAGMAQETLRQTDLNILGLIVNGVRSIQIKMPQPDLPVTPDEPVAVDFLGDMFNPESTTLAQGENSTEGRSPSPHHLNQPSELHQADTAADVIETEDTEAVETTLAMETMAEYAHLFQEDYSDTVVTHAYGEEGQDTMVEPSNGHGDHDTGGRNGHGYADQPMVVTDHDDDLDDGEDIDPDADTDIEPKPKPKLERSWLSSVTQTWRD